MGGRPLGTCRAGGRASAGDVRRPGAPRAACASALRGFAPAAALPGGRRPVCARGRLCPRPAGGARELEPAGRTACRAWRGWRGLRRSSAAASSVGHGGYGRAHRLSRSAGRGAGSGRGRASVRSDGGVRRAAAYGGDGGELQAGDQCAQCAVARLHCASVGLRVSERPLDSVARRLANRRGTGRGRRVAPFLSGDSPDDGRPWHDGDGTRHRLLVPLAAGGCAARACAQPRHLVAHDGNQPPAADAGLPAGLAAVGGRPWDGPRRRARLRRLGVSEGEKWQSGKVEKWKGGEGGRWKDGKVGRC